MKNNIKKYFATYPKRSYTLGGLIGEHGSEGREGPADRMCRGGRLAERLTTGSGLCLAFMAVSTSPAVVAVPAFLTYATVAKVTGFCLGRKIDKALQEKIPPYVPRQDRTL